MGLRAVLWRDHALGAKLGTLCRQLHRESQAAEELRPSATTPCEVGRQPLSAEICDIGGH